MKPISIDKLKIVAEAFRVSISLAEHNADNIYGRDELPVEAMDEIAGDMAIIADRVRVAQATLEDAVPGFSALVVQADIEAQVRARRMLKK